MITLDNVTVPDLFPTENAQQPAAIMFPAIKSNGGYFQISGNPVYIELAYTIEAGDFGHGQARWTKAIPFPTGPGLILPGTVGVRFQNYTPGKVATVSGALAEHAEPSIQVTSSGSISSGAGSGLTPTLISALPATPTDGQQVLAVDTLVGIPTYAWALQWNQTMGRWVFIGGSPFIVEDNGTSQTFSNTSYAALPRSVKLSLPRTGQYELFGGVEIHGSNVGDTEKFTVRLGTTAAADTELISRGVGGGGGGSGHGSAGFMVRSGTINDVWEVYCLTGSGTANYQFVRIGIRPMFIQ